MIDKNIAIALSNFALEVSSQATKTLIDLEPLISQEQMQKAKLAIGKVLGETYFLASPIWDAYPELKPKELS